MKTLRKDTLRLISTTKGRFLTLVAIVALGVAFFVGVSASADIMAQNIDHYNDVNHLKDITVYSNYGFDQSDIIAVSKLPFISEVETSKFVDTIANGENKTLVTRIHSYHSHTKLNQFVLVEGRMPQNKNEVLAERVTVTNPLFDLGETVSISRPSDDLLQYTDIDTVKIVGLIDTPLYLNHSKENSTLDNRDIQTYFYVPEDFFVIDYDTEMNILIKDAVKYNSFSNQYEKYIAEYADKIEQFAKNQALVRQHKILKEAEEKYTEGYQSYQSNLEKYENEIFQAENQLKEAKKKIDNGKNSLKAGRQRLQDSQVELDGQKKVQEKNLQNARETLDFAKNEILKQKQEFQVQAKVLTEKITEIDAGIKTLQEAQNMVKTARKSYQEINDGLTKIQENKQQLKIAIDTFQQLVNDLMALDSETLQEVLQRDDGKLQVYIEQMNLPVSLTIQEVQEHFSMQLQQLEQQENMLNSSMLELQKTLANHQLTVDTLAEKEQELAQSILDLNKKRKNIIDGLAQGNAKLSQAQQTIAQKEKEYSIGYQRFTQEMTQGQEKINQGWKEIDKNQNILNRSIQTYQNGEKELENQRIDGQQKLEQAKADLAKAKQDIDALSFGKWTVLTREKHYSSKAYRNTIQQMKAIAAVFPAFFFFVAGLVCLTTMTRMIDEQRGQIGILRALGYTRFQCAKKYLIYAMCSTILGEVLGIVIGLLTFPKIIYEAWRIMYQEPIMQLYIPYQLIVIIVCSFLIVMLLTTWFTCIKDMNDVPSALLRPKTEVNMGKKQFIDYIPHLWKYFSFSWKATIRNMTRSRRRMLLTMVGVSGCMALLLIGYGIRDSIRIMIDKQFNEIVLNDGAIQFQKQTDISMIKDINNNLNKDSEIENSLLIGNYVGALTGKKEVVNASVQVIENEKEFKKFVHLRNRKQKKEISLSKQGIVISEKLAEQLYVEKGDIIQLESENKVIREVKVEDICEMYIQHYVFMSTEAYQYIYGSAMPLQTILIQIKANADYNKVQEKLASLEQVESVIFIHGILEHFHKMVKSLDFIVGVLILSSMTLAFVVLGNLTNINISERQREIATLKVLGFRRKEIQNYIFRENNLLVLFGALMGLPLGIILHRYIIKKVEMDYVMFGRDIQLESMIISVVLTYLFGLIVHFFMRKKLSHVEMVESLKSVE